MPELPEVETIARGVDERLRGDRIETVWFSEKPEPFKSLPRLMASELAGRRIDRVYRVGKHIVFDLEGSLQWIVHLGMTGRLLVADPETAVPHHTHAILHLLSGKELRFVDPRRFGRLALHGSPDTKELRASRGPARNLSKSRRMTLPRSSVAAARRSRLPC